ncbi:Cyclin-dependent kinase A-1 [Diplonema papillatum]|nr:Cyclin-dependent kinase A-1 [Diplonema papillatum]KAJ9445518.1 Cyclin-dependent kinase A-1 [Diplonema papillatum]
MQSFDDELRVLKEVFRDLEVEEGEQGCVLVIPVGDDPVRRPRLSVTVPQCYATGGKRAEVVTGVPRPPGKKRGKKKKPGDKAKFRALNGNRARPSVALDGLEPKYSQQQLRVLDRLIDNRFESHEQKNGENTPGAIADVVAFALQWLTKPLCGLFPEDDPCYRIAPVPPRTHVTTVRELDFLRVTGEGVHGTVYTAVYKPGCGPPETELPSQPRRYLDPDADLRDLLNDGDAMASDRDGSTTADDAGILSNPTSTAGGGRNGSFGSFGLAAKGSSKRGSGAAKDAGKEYVAVKKFLGRTETVSQDVLREIAALARLRGHPYVVGIKGLIVTHELKLVMTHHHRTLHDIRFKRDHHRITRIFYQLLTVADFLKQQRIVHRDWKPANVLWDDNEQMIKLADFGQTALYDPVYMWHKHIFTLDYRPPEISLGSSQYGSETDVWCIALIIYFMIVRGPLFDTSDDDKDKDLLGMIFGELGAPNEVTWPGVTKMPHYRTYRGIVVKYLTGKAKVKPTLRSYVLKKDKDDVRWLDMCDLLERMLRLCPASRITAEAAKEHPLFVAVVNEMTLEVDQQAENMKQADQYVHPPKFDASPLLPAYAATPALALNRSKVLFETLKDGWKFFPMSPTVYLLGIHFFDSFLRAVGGSQMLPESLRLLAITAFLNAHKIKEDHYFDADVSSDEESDEESGEASSIELLEDDESSSESSSSSSSSSREITEEASVPSPHHAASTPPAAAALACGSSTPKHDLDEPPAACDPPPVIALPAEVVTAEPANQLAGPPPADAPPAADGAANAEGDEAEGDDFDDEAEDSDDDDDDDEEDSYEETLSASSSPERLEDLEAWLDSIDATSSDLLKMELVLIGKCGVEVLSEVTLAELRDDALLDDTLSSSHRRFFDFIALASMCDTVVPHKYSQRQIFAALKVLVKSEAPPCEEVAATCRDVVAALKKCPVPKTILSEAEKEMLKQITDAAGKPKAKKAKKPQQNTTTSGQAVAKKTSGALRSQTAGNTPSNLKSEGRKAPALGRRGSGVTIDSLTSSIRSLDLNGSRKSLNHSAKAK